MKNLEGKERKNEKYTGKKSMVGLRYLMNVFNLKISDLAEGSRIKESIVYNWLKGIEKIPECYKKLLEKRFGVPRRFF